MFFATLLGFARRRQTPAGERQANHGRLLVAAGLVAALVGGAFGSPLGFPVGAAAAQARSAPDSFADLAERLQPAVVNISTTQKVQVNQRRGPEGMPQFPPGSPFEEFFRDFFERQQREGARPPRPVTSLGSGFIIDADGYVVTNNHVIADADEVKVILHDDTELPAKIIGRDTKTDLALLKVESKQKLPAVRWGDSDKTRVGDWVLAIGNPFGLGGSVTAGIVSARGRNIRAGPYDDFIQTDASINKGNSGGPLFNMSGEVVGVNTAIFSQTGGSIGIGFAVPSALARPVIAQLREFGRTKRGWLGVRIQTVTDEIAESLQLDRSRGALVAGVTEGGPAEKAKIEAGDVILSFDGKPVPNMTQLPRIVAETQIGKEVPVEVWRKGKSRSLRVTVGELPETEQLAAAEAAPTPKGGAGEAEKAVDLLGLKVAPLTPELRQRYDIKDDVKGVVVTEVVADGPAAKKDIRAGDVIVEVSQSEVRSPDEVVGKLKELQQDPKRRSALLLIQRAGDLRFVAVPFKS